MAARFECVGFASARKFEPLDRGSQRREYGVGGHASLDRQKRCMAPRGISFRAGPTLGGLGSAPFGAATAAGSAGVTRSARWRGADQRGDSGGGVFLEDFEGDNFERPLVGGGEHDGRSHVKFDEFEPAGGAHAPAVAWFQPWKIVLGARRGEVIADEATLFEEPLGDLHAYGVAAVILDARVAVAVAKEPGARGVGAGLQRAAEDIARGQGRHGGRS